MKKYLLSGVCVVMCLLSVNAQVAYDTRIAINKTEVPGTAVDLDYSQKLIKDFLTQELSKRQMKAKSSKGMMIYSMAVLSEISDFRLDYYFKISKRNSSKTSEFSKLELTADKGDASFSLMNEEKETVQKMKDFLNKFAKDLAVYAADKDIANQEALNKKTMDNQAKATKQLESLQKDKDKLDKKIEEKQKEVNQYQQELDTQKSNLDNMRSRRGSM